MNPDPVKIGFIFLGASCTSLGFGATLLYFAWIGFRDASYPLTQTVQLRGVLARFAAFVIGVFGMLVIGCGIATPSVRLFPIEAATLVIASCWIRIAANMRTPNGNDQRHPPLHSQGTFRLITAKCPFGEREPPMTRVLKSQFFGGGPVTAAVMP